MYVSPWPGLRPRDFLPVPARHRPPYPLAAEGRISFHVARSGIYHLFRALQFKARDVVLVPDYFSGTEVAAIRAARASIVFYPIHRNLEPDLDALSRLARLWKPRAIYAIHYLGWPQPIRQIQAVCREWGSILIEDCALSLFSEMEGKPLGTFGDYSVFCLYKTLPVPNGGLLVQNRNTLPELSVLNLERCPRITAWGRSLELSLETLRSRADRIGKILFAVKQACGWVLRKGGARHLPVGAMDWNMASVTIAMSRISRLVMEALDYDEIRQRRRANYLMLRQRLDGRVKMLRPDFAGDVCPLFFPILVEDKHAAAQALWRRGIGVVEFWNDELHGPNGNIGPEARYLRAHVLELPIHQGVTPAQVQYIADQVLALNLQSARC